MNVVPAHSCPGQNWHHLPSTPSLPGCAMGGKPASPWDPPSVLPCEWVGFGRLAVGGGSWRWWYSGERGLGALSLGIWLPDWSSGHGAQWCGHMTLVLGWQVGPTEVRSGSGKQGETKGASSCWLQELQQKQIFGGQDCFPLSLKSADYWRLGLIWRNLLGEFVADKTVCLFHTCMATC